MKKIIFFLFFYGVLCYPFAACAQMPMNVSITLNPTEVVLNQNVQINVLAEEREDMPASGYYKTYLYIQPSKCFTDPTFQGDFMGTPINCNEERWGMAVAESAPFSNSLTHNWLPNNLISFTLRAIARTQPPPVGSQYGEMLGITDLTVTVVSQPTQDEDDEEEPPAGQVGDIAVKTRGPGGVGEGILNLFTLSSRLEKLEDLPNVIASLLLGLVGVIAFLAIIYGGYIYLTAGGNVEQEAKAKKILIYAIVGVIVIAGSYALVHYIEEGFGIT